MKKSISPEQQKQRDERKARFAALVKKVGAMSDESGESQNTTGQDGKARVAFLSGTVFDISQTMEIQTSEEEAA